MSRRMPELEPRLRFSGSSEAVFGPGKADLLRHIAATGSISRSAARMKMSYNRAWTLVREMNHLFSDPLVAAVRGGISGGGASLTRMGVSAAKAAITRNGYYLPVRALASAVAIACIQADRSSVGPPTDRHRLYVRASLR